MIYTSQNVTAAYDRAVLTRNFKKIDDAINNLQGATNAVTTSTSSFRNILINGDMSISQAGTSFTSSTVPINSDGTYLMDRWCLLSDGNNIVNVAQSTTVPTGSYRSQSLTIQTTNKKFGILQIVEQSNCQRIVGGDVVLSFQAKMSSVTKLDNMKAAIVAWTSTADSPTKDIISSWGAEGTNPTLVANWAYVNTPANLIPTTSWASYSVSGAVPSNTKNIGVFIWSDVTDTTASDVMYVTDVQLEAGSTASSFEQRPIGLEGYLCTKYFLRRQSIGNPDYLACLQAQSTTSSFGVVMVMPQIMRVDPTATISSISHLAPYKPDGTLTTAFSSINGTLYVIKQLLVCSGFLHGTANWTAGQAVNIAFNSASGYFDISAELGV